MKKVVIITTGGTIACKADEAGCVKPSLTGEDLVKTVPGIEKITEFDVENFSQVPGGDLAFDGLLKLARRVDQLLKQDDIKGVVITQGTDSMEEVAYFMDLVIDSDKPLVLTGSMRTPDAAGFDGPANLLDALALASSEGAQGLGVTVVMNGKIHGAQFVSKGNTFTPDAFVSQEAGILGYICEKRPYLLSAKTQKTQKIPMLQSPIDRVDLRVELLKTTLGCSPSVLDYLVQEHVPGIIIEAMGGAHMPSWMLDPIHRATQKGIPLVVTSRCGSGPLLRGTYSFVGSEQSLQAAGVLFSDLPGLKARIKLIVALNTPGVNLTDYFN